MRTKFTLLALLLVLKPVTLFANNFSTKQQQIYGKWECSSEWENDVLIGSESVSIDINEISKFYDQSGKFEIRNKKAPEKSSILEYRAVLLYELENMNMISTSDVFEVKHIKDELSIFGEEKIRSFKKKGLVSKSALNLINPNRIISVTESGKTYECHRVHS